MPHHLSPEPCSLPPPSARHRHSGSAGTSTLSIWLSVDPLADKYPSTSPYTYCANNPVKLVDPNGREWELNENGYMRRVGDENNNTVYMVTGKAKDEFGTRIVNKKGEFVSMTLNSSVMGRGYSTGSCSAALVTEDGVQKDAEGKTIMIQTSFLKLDFTDNEKLAQQFFRFVSQNTDVEWSYWKTSDGEISLSNSHLPYTDGYGPSMAFAACPKNGLLCYHHSHPRWRNDGFMTDDYDKDFARKCRSNGSPSAKFGIMHNRILYDYKGFSMSF